MVVTAGPVMTWLADPALARLRTSNARKSLTANRSSRPTYSSARSGSLLENPTVYSQNITQTMPEHDTLQNSNRLTRSVTGNIPFTNTDWYQHLEMPTRFNRLFRLCAQKRRVVDLSLAEAYENGKPALKKKRAPRNNRKTQDPGSK